MMCSTQVDLMRQLVAIDSVNPDLIPGAAGEGAIADWCSEWLSAHGFEVERLEERPGRPSIVGRARGTGGGRTLMLNGHLDTVGTQTFAGDPFAAEVRDGKISAAAPST
jgi:acetylornithine deacetylase